MRAKTKLMSDTKIKVPYHDEYEFWKLWCRASHLVVRARVTEVSRFGVSPIQAGVLMFLKESTEPCTTSDIIRWLMREPQAVSQLLDRMKKQGLVRKTKDSRKRNMLRVKITEKGEEIYQGIKNIKIFQKALSNLTESEREALWSALDKMQGVAVQELLKKNQLRFPLAQNTDQNEIESK